MSHINTVTARNKETYKLNGRVALLKLRGAVADYAIDKVVVLHG